MPSGPTERFLLEISLSMITSLMWTYVQCLFDLGLLSIICLIYSTTKYTSSRNRQHLLWYNRRSWVFYRFVELFKIFEHFCKEKIQTYYAANPSKEGEILLINEFKSQKDKQYWRIFKNKIKFSIRNLSIEII